MFKITKVAGRRWSGRWIPACYRVDQITETGAHVCRVDVFDTLADAEAAVAALTA